MNILNLSRFKLCNCLDLGVKKGQILMQLEVTDILIFTFC